MDLKERGKRKRKEGNFRPPKNGGGRVGFRKSVITGFPKNHD